MNTLSGKQQSQHWLPALKASTTRLIDGSAVIVPPSFLFGSLALESIQPGFDRLTDTVSMLVLGTSGWLQTVLFYLMGLTLLSVAWRMRSCLAGKSSRAATVLLAGASLGFALIAIFPTGVLNAPLTPAAAIHEGAAIAVSAMSPLASLVLAYSLKTNRPFAAICRLLLVAGITGLLLDIVGLIIFIFDLSWIGALERLVILNGLVWIEGVAVCLLKARPPVSNVPAQWHMRDILGMLKPKLLRQPQTVRVHNFNKKHWPHP